MHKLEAIDLGTYRGENYVLVGFVDPEPVEGGDYDPDQNADEYGVTLARLSARGSNVEIVPLDNAHGQEPHMDLAYLPTGVDSARRVELGEGYTYERMRQYLLTNWQGFVDSYLTYDG